MSVLIGAIIPPTSNVTNGLVGWWTFDEGMGSTANDSSVSVLTGTLVNTPTWISGQIGLYALTFDGATNYVVMTGTPSSFNFTNTTFSVAGWFQTTSSGGDVIIAKGCSAGGSGGNWMVRINDGFSGTLRGALKTGTGNIAGDRYSSSTTVNDGNWHHFVIVFTTDTSITANNVADLYLDGALNNGTTVSQVGPYGTEADDLSIGVRDVSNTPASFFNGSIDDIRIYNRGLSALEVATIYNYR